MNPRARAPRTETGQRMPPDRGFLERALEIAWEATQHEPENAAPWIHLGNVHLVALRALAAERAYAQALQRDPANVPARLNMAYAAALAGKWDRAINLAISAAANAPAEYHATLRVRHLRAARHLLLDANDLYARKDQTQPFIRLQRGYAYDAQGQAREAEREYRQALVLDPEYDPAAEALAFLALHEGNNRQALHYAVRAVNIGEERAEAWLALGYARLALKEPEEAVMALTRSIGLDPNLPYSRRAIARAWSTLGELRRAEEDCRHAVTIDPCWAEARLALGDALFGLGLTNEAWTVYREAVAGNPECLDADGQNGLAFALGAW
jgi:tetratricopeptide (TPR) repeat protein